jgi:very-short-patch-repair endonuclease
VEGGSRPTPRSSTLVVVVEPSERSWRDVAAAQAGLLTRTQLRAVGVDRWAVAHRVGTERWQRLSSVVIATTTGACTREQRMWLGVLHAGEGALVGGLSAAECAGLRNWHRDEVTVLVPYRHHLPEPVDGVEFVRTRRDLGPMRRRLSGLPCSRIEPAILLFAAADDSERTAQGVLAAAVQQRLTTPDLLLSWVDRLSPLRRAPLLRRALDDMAGGAQSLAEIDVRRMCRRHRLAPPQRQARRRDADGRWRFTDCEWRLADGRTLVLEVDGAFHMSVESWEDDLARQRSLSSVGRLVVRCTARELRDESERVARDLVALGVPRAA